jgi:uncharacterized protein YjiS (DUF1127 family)
LITSAISSKANDRLTRGAAACAVGAWLEGARDPSRNRSAFLCCSAQAGRIAHGRDRRRDRKAQKFMDPMKTIAEKLAAWRRYRETVRELTQMSDRELHDIGVRRADIPLVAAGAVKG